jgi:hypothetical protein
METKTPNLGWKVLFSHRRLNQKLSINNHKGNYDTRTAFLSASSWRS